MLERLPKELPFCPRDFEFDREAERIVDYIDNGILPFDTLFRLASVGVHELDTLVEHKYPKSRYYMVMRDIAAHAEYPEAMRPDTRTLLWGERPDGIVDWGTCHTNYDAYAQLEPMYYCMDDLIDAIVRKRAHTGKTITSAPDRSPFGPTPERLERSVCKGAARGIWKVLIARTHPEWIERPGDYYPTFISFDQVHYAGDKTMSRRNIRCAVLSDTLVHRLYTEAIETRVKGIGPEGTTSLRELLIDEHPELA